MPPGPELAGCDPSDLRRGHITYFPVVAGRAEFAVEVRRALLSERPSVVAVELPAGIESELLRALKRLPELSVVLATPLDEADEAVYVPIEPADPFVEAARTALEIGARLLLLEPDAFRRPHIPAVYPDSYAVRLIGRRRYIEQYRLFPPQADQELQAHAAAMAWKLQGADPFAPTVAVVSLNVLEALLEAMEEPQSEPPAAPALEYRLLNPHPECLAEITSETPYLQERYEQWRAGPLEVPFPDRPRLQYELLKEAEQAYAALTLERIAHWQRRLLARFSRNLAQVSGELVASLYDLTLAARSVVGDNYAWEVWQTANRYGPQREACELETVKLSAAEIFINTRRLRIRRRLPRPKQLTRPARLKPRPQEKSSGEWAQSIDGNAICSYPPEDLVVEEFGRSLKQKAKRILAGERVHVEPFSTSLLDGVDVRETIRRWHEGKIYVRRMEQVGGEVGAVVLIFDEDRENRYRYLMTWLGEHQNESDLAFYSTDPFERLVGPGIGRAEYGGLMMTHPPLRVFDVWSDPDYDGAETKAERLLLAALDYSLARNVVYAGPRPPRTIFRSIAAHLGRRIIYVPLGQLAPDKLRKVRVVHVLAGRDKRAIAREYLW